MASYMTKIAKDYGYTVSGSVAYKRVKDFMVTISDTDDGHLRCCISVDEFSLTELNKKAITRTINKSATLYTIAKFRWDESGVDVIFQKVKDLETYFNKFVEDITAQLIKSNVKGLQACAICGKNNDNDSSLFYLYGFVCGIHQHCMQQYDQEVHVSTSNAKKYSQGKLISGVFGAFWGSLIAGALLVIVLGLLSGTAAAKWLPLLAFFIPLSAKFQYEVLDGFKDGLTKFIVVTAISLFATVYAVAAGNALAAYSETKEFTFQLFSSGTKYGLIAAAVMACLMNYKVITVKKSKQQFKVD